MSMGKEPNVSILEIQEKGAVSDHNTVRIAVQGEERDGLKMSNSKGEKKTPA